MFTIIGADGKEYGPVTAEKLREWIASGRANAQTQCRREGEVAWSTLGSLPEFAGLFGGSAGASAPRAEFVPPATGPVDPKAYADAVLAAGGRVDVFDCLGKAFSTLKANFLPMVIATGVVFLVQIVAGLIPLIGFLSQLLLTGVFYGGLCYYHLGRIRGEPRELSDAFAGFSKALGPLMLSTLLQTALIFALMLVFVAPIFGTLIPLFAGGADPDAVTVFAPLTIGLMVAGGLVSLFVSVAWIFAYTLIIDRGLGVWSSIAVSWRVVTKHWFSVFFVALFGGILACLGLIALIIGVFITLPIFFSALMHAYESLFNPGRAPTTRS